MNDVLRRACCWVANLLVIVGAGTPGADGFALHRIERLASDRFRAVPTDETVRVPLAVESRDVVLHDGPVAPVAFRCEHVEVVVAAVRLAVALVEPVLAELLAALGAEEVLGVPRFFQCRHTFIQDRPITVGTAGTEEVVVVRLAVRVAIALEEVPRAELLVAVVAREVFRVPGLAERRDDLADDRLVAGVAAALLRGVHTLATHVGREVTEHRIELIGRRR